ncbi:CHAT domain-containing protein [Rhodopirellula sp. MGV]|uniref:CHAT domain-containing protein n=1 Tax=Rhodopirellula sp. MGV TaxID=2023130 RepID=UPI000BD570F4|nr:CHAT domain-containing protein [Rhodopirellula sp. MGV]OYP39090.1 hypothetical protein CGZ80_00100 [Rhodopirellula sp. MGV]
MKGKRVRTVELQLLRHGPPHNQLLSPLTNYLALCGDHPNTTLNFPIEHESLVVQLRTLRYRDSEETRRIQMHEAASLVAGMLADVPGLISELGYRDSSAEALVHLSIASSASELSLVPFELSNAPPGFPGSGGPLSLQTEFPVCITRRSRNVRCEMFKWDAKPRVLMIASEAGGSVPLESHYALLRRLLEPWIAYDFTTGNVNDEAPPIDFNRESLDEYLVLLADASVKEINDTIRDAIDQNRAFTHIHVLAHGCRLPFQSESFGVALKNPSSGEHDPVDGKRLGLLLSGKLIDDPRMGVNNKNVRPLSVTLAVCDSGNKGIDVAKPGASVAFHVHEAGIPLVIGSQFPLTKSGSVVFADSIYRQLLNGADPRVGLWEARRELFALSAERGDAVGRHDWASIIAFAAFPHNIEIQAKQLECDQIKRRMAVKLKSGDGAIGEQKIGSSSNQSETIIPPHFDKLACEVADEVKQFDRFVDANKRSKTYVEMLGISASANKRAAELLWINQSNSEDSPDDVWMEFVWRSHYRYMLITDLDANHSWALVQTLFLKRFISFYSSDNGYTDDLSWPETELLGGEDSLFQTWFQTMYLCREKELLESQTNRQKIWHLTDLIELALLRTLIPGFEKPSTVRLQLRERFSLKNVVKWLKTIDRLDVLERANHEQVNASYSGYRQILRYRRFAEMMYSDPDRTGYRYKQRSRRMTGEPGGGYQKLIARYGEFREMFERVERHIREQIEIRDA